MVKRILYPTDFSPSSQTALAYALQWAEEHQAALHLLHVISWRKPETIGASMEDATKDKIAALLAKHPDHPTNLVKRTVVGQPVADIIVDYAKQHQIDLIVQGTHGNRGLKHWVLGSVAEKVSREAPCPVMTVRADAPVPQGPSRKLLAAIDFLPPSAHVLRYAQALAARRSGTLTVLHVVEQRHPLAGQDGGFLAAVQSLPDLEHHRAQMLATFCDKHLTNDMGQTADQRVVTGHPVKEILAQAQDLGADLLILGVDEDDLIGRHLLGSIVERVIRLAPLPVLTLKGED